MTHRIPAIVLASAIILSSAGIAAAEAPIELRFAGGTFRPDDSAPDVPERGPSGGSSRGATGLHYLVAVVDGGLDEARRRQMESAGAEILDYLPVHGYRVRLASGSVPSVRALPFVRWLGETPSRFKLQPELGDPSASPQRIRVILAASEPARRVNALLAGQLVSAAPSGRDGAWRIEAELATEDSAALLEALAALPEVEGVERVRPLRVSNQDAVWVHQSFVGPSPQQTPIFDHGIFGCGQTVAVADTGQDYDSCYFADPVNGPPPVVLCATPPCPVATPASDRRKDILYYNWSGTVTGDDDTCPSILLTGSGHGTHTSGSAAGDNAPYADCSGFSSPARNGGDGQAPGAKLIVQELGDGLEYVSALGGTVWNLADVAHRSGADIHSISWGGVCHDLLGNCVPGCTLPYDSFARDTDLAMWVHPDLLMVQSAGNSGEFCPPPDSITTPAIAKSPVTVGALGHGGNADTPLDVSSRGPVFDGRLKPTVSAQGDAVVSAASDAVAGSANCASCSLTGSSMSAPLTAGLAALVREYYTAGFYASGVRDPGAGFVPSGALLKATLIDGASALGAGPPAADFDAGFGRVLLGSTLAFDDSTFALRVDDHREGIGTGGVVSHAYDVAAGTELRVTLVWTDYPAALNAADARVNELRLEVTDPGGDVWFQSLAPATGLPGQTRVASDPHDTVNVEERLVFPTPTPGRWIVRVLGVDVPWGPQPFALVVRGAVSDCPAPASPGPLTLDAPADGQVLVSWNAVPGAAAYNVYRGFGACPADPWIPVATGVGGTSFLDGAVSGGAEYGYHVTAVSDADAACESTRSPCASIVPTGDCLLAPEFRGATWISQNGTAECSLTLGWDPASSFCGSTLYYNVYRDSAPGFVPGPGNRIAGCLTAHEFTDAVDLSHATAYHYVVRAEDGTSGHGGPCAGGNEESNVVTVSSSPTGPPALGTWVDDAGDTGTAKMLPGPSWGVSPTGGDSAPAVYAATSAALLCTDLTTPPLTLDSPGQGPQLSFSTIHDLEYDPFGVFGAEGSIGQVEIATGPDFNNWTRVPLNPDYPTPVDFPFNECSSTAGIDHYFSGTNLSYTTYGASLVNWAGGEVMIRFHLSGDFIYPGGNWWVDDISVTQSLVPGSCATAAAGPPAIPDGASVPGNPLVVDKSGGDVLLAWDTSRCPAVAVNVYRGAIGDFSTFVAGDCDLAGNGSATLPMPADSWFLVVATDGGAIDGSFSRDATGNELSYSGSTTVCPAITQHVTNHACP